MANTITGSQKFSSLEIVDSAKFDNEIVFDMLSMIGGNLSIITEEDITLSSTNTTEPGGINIMSGLDINIMCTFDASTIWITGGNNTPKSQVSGSVVMGYNTETKPFETFQVEFDGSDALVSFFGNTPVVQQGKTIPSASYTSIGGNVVSTLDTFDGYTIGQIISALKNYGLLK